MMTLRPCITEQQHKDLLSVMCRREIMAMRVCMDGILALILEWHMCLSNATNFCDKGFPVLIQMHPGLYVLKMCAQEGPRGIFSAMLPFQADCRLREALYHILPLGHKLKAWILSQLAKLKISFNCSRQLDRFSLASRGWTVQDFRGFCFYQTLEILLLLSQVCVFTSASARNRERLHTFCSVRLHSFPRAKFSFLKKEVKLETTKVLIVTHSFSSLLSGFLAGDLDSLRKQIPSSRAARAVSPP